mmetsp:Transcript_63309/g.147451  ORF Transcript_63309/g.147451 Transcript_63309/m.147451 type:complete len:324 (-) Transcript_63309:2285-3256(-)
MMRSDDGGRRIEQHNGDCCASVCHGILLERLAKALERTYELVPKRAHGVGIVQQQCVVSHGAFAVPISQLQQLDIRWLLRLEEQLLPRLCFMLELSCLLLACVHARSLGPCFLALLVCEERLYDLPRARCQPLNLVSAEPHLVLQVTLAEHEAILPWLALAGCPSFDLGLLGNQTREESLHHHHLIPRRHCEVDATAEGSGEKSDLTGSCCSPDIRIPPIWAHALLKAIDVLPMRILLQHFRVLEENQDCILGFPFVLHEALYARDPKLLCFLNIHVLSFLEVQAPRSKDRRSISKVFDLVVILNNVSDTLHIQQLLQRTGYS